MPQVYPATIPYRAGFNHRKSNQVFGERGKHILVRVAVDEGPIQVFTDCRQM